MCQFLMISCNQLSFGMSLSTLRTHPSQDNLVFHGALGSFPLHTPTFPGLSHQPLNRWSKASPSTGLSTGLSSWSWCLEDHMPRLFCLVLYRLYPRNVKNYSVFGVKITPRVSV